MRTAGRPGSGWSVPGRSCAWPWRTGVGASCQRRSCPMAGPASGWVWPACSSAWPGWGGSARSRAGRAQAPACWSRCRCLQRTEVRMAAEAPVPARIMIVDDHALAREGLRAMLAHQHDLAVIAEAVDAGEARALCRSVQPDLLLMDVRMPGMDGLAATAAIKQEFPAIRVIIITMYENPDYLLQAIKAGAAGYLLKNATAREILTAVRQVLRGEFPLRPDVAAHLLQRLTPRRQPPATLSEDQLAPREQAVLRLVAQGQ